MIKNLFILIFISALFISCGKKGDPIYNEEKISMKFFINQISRSA